MKIVISQPMKGKTKEEIGKERNDVIETARKRGDEVIDNVFWSCCQKEEMALISLAWSLEKIAKADVVVFMKGYEEARGCKIEYLVCKEYGIRTMIEAEYCEIPTGV